VGDNQSKAKRQPAAAGAAAVGENRRCRKVSPCSLPFHPTMADSLDGTLASQLTRSLLPLFLDPGTRSRFSGRKLINAAPAETAFPVPHPFPAALGPGDEADSAGENQFHSGRWQQKTKEKSPAVTGLNDISIRRHLPLARGRHGGNFEALFIF
jgi:hypothetical protein